jgi:hypothetical protein
MTGAKKSSGEGHPITFVPAISFTGYPRGKKTKFTAGEESAPVPAGFLEMVRTKGFVRKEGGSNHEERA